MQIEELKLEILREARKNKQQIFKVKSSDTEFVKVRRGYSQPEEARIMYLDALTELVDSGLVSNIFDNTNIELFELTRSGDTSCPTVRSAREEITEALQMNGRIYKVHSAAGEFIQSVSQCFKRNEDERIVYLKALHELLYHGVVQVASENREMATFQLALPDSGYVQYMHVPPLSAVALIAQPVPDALVTKIA